jgi:hypothetical protein
LRIRVIRFDGIEVGAARAHVVRGWAIAGVMIRRTAKRTSLPVVLRIYLMRGLAVSPGQ